MPRWGALPNAAVALLLTGMGLSDMTMGLWSAVCVGLGTLYAVDVGLFLRRPPRMRGRRFGSRLLSRLMRPLLVPLLRLSMFGVSRGFLSNFKRNHRGVMQLGERLLLTVREAAKDGDVWVLSDQAIYEGPKTSERRLPRTRVRTSWTFQKQRWATRAS